MILNRLLQCFSVFLARNLEVCRQKGIIQFKILKFCIILGLLAMLVVYRVNTTLRVLGFSR